jgi:hypothetical protein
MLRWLRPEMASLSTWNYEFHILQFSTTKVGYLARSQWLMPVILATQEAEIRRTAVQSQPGQEVHETLP